MAARATLSGPTAANAMSPTPGATRPAPNRRSRRSPNPGRRLIERRGSCKAWRSEFSERPVAGGGLPLPIHCLRERARNWLLVTGRRDVIRLIARGASGRKATTLNCLNYIVDRPRKHASYLRRIAATALNREVDARSRRAGRRESSRDCLSVSRAEGHPDGAVSSGARRSGASNFGCRETAGSKRSSTEEALCGRVIPVSFVASSLTFLRFLIFFPLNGCPRGRHLCASATTVIIATPAPAVARQPLSQGADDERRARSPRFPQQRAAQ
jgi:hypothetical protein